MGGGGDESSDVVSAAGAGTEVGLAVTLVGFWWGTKVG